MIEQQSSQAQTNGILVFQGGGVVLHETGPDDKIFCCHLWLSLKPFFTWNILSSLTQDNRTVTVSATVTVEYLGSVKPK